MGKVHVQSSNFCFYLKTGNNKFFMQEFKPLSKRAGWSGKQIELWWPAEVQRSCSVSQTRSLWWNRRFCWGFLLNCVSITELKLLDFRIFHYINCLFKWTSLGWVQPRFGSCHPKKFKGCQRWPLKTAKLGFMAIHAIVNIVSSPFPDWKKWQ